MYKDKDKQREAIKAATQRYRAKKGDSALSGSKEVSQNARGLPVLDEVGDTLPVIPKGMAHNDAVYNYSRNPVELVKPKRGKAIKYENGGITVPDKLGPLKPVTEQQLVKVAKQQFTKELAKIFDVPTGKKRGKDIKSFADLPPDIQKIIDMMSLVEGKIDKTIKANRTAIAVNYQHLFPGQFEPHWFAAAMSVAGKPGDADYNGVCTEAWRAERGR